MRGAVSLLGMKGIKLEIIGKNGCGEDYFHCGTWCQPVAQIQSMQFLKPR